MNITQYLSDHHVAYEVIPHLRTESASRLAHEVHAPGAKVAKTVLLHVNHGYHDVIAVLPATSHLVPSQMSELFGGAEIRFGTEDDVALHCPDCERGVLPPFGSQYGMETVVDESLTQNDDIIFEGNTHAEAIRMRWRDYLRLENPLIGYFAAPGAPPGHRHV